ncbi:MAG TPA: hypothetical protein VGB19_05860 [Actinomycetota bacterium]
MRSRTPALLIALFCLAAAGVLGLSSAGAAPRPAAKAAKAVQCGEWRWGVKTLSDGRAKGVGYRPLVRKVGFLRGLPEPSFLDSSTKRIRHSAEMRTYTIKVALLKAALEEDHDIHLVVAPAAAKAKSMIVEFPDPKCKGAAGSYKKAKIAAARSALLNDCGAIGSGSTKLTGTATITGVGFYDAKHGQDGEAPNGIELHPVLAYTGTCSKAGTGGGGGGGGGSNCDQSYPTVCIPPPPPDLDCGDIQFTNFKVVPPDDQGFDGDGDGVGCET